MRASECALSPLTCAVCKTFTRDICARQTKLMVGADFDLLVVVVVFVVVHFTPKAGSASDSKREREQAKAMQSAHTHAHKFTTAS